MVLFGEGGKACKGEQEASKVLVTLLYLNLGSG